MHLFTNECKGDRILKKLLIILIVTILIPACSHSQDFQPLSIEIQPVEIREKPKLSGTLSVYNSCGVPDSISTDRKVWMDYRTITDKESAQWKLQREAATDENGLRRIGDLYMVAVGTYYTEECGELLTIVFEDGSFIDAIVADIKADQHTDQKNQYTPISKHEGNVVEFIVDIRHLNEEALIHGDVSPIGLHGNVVEILKEVESYQF